MTHVVHGFYFGTRPTPRKYYELKKLHPLGLNPEWLDKLHGQEFFSEHTQHTHEHYLQVCFLVLWVESVQPGWGIRFTYTVTRLTKAC